MKYKHMNHEITQDPAYLASGLVGTLGGLLGLFLGIRLITLVEILDILMVSLVTLVAQFTNRFVAQISKNGLGGHDNDHKV